MPFHTSFRPEAAFNFLTWSGFRKECYGVCGFNVVHIYVSRGRRYVQFHFCLIFSGINVKPI